MFFSQSNTVNQTMLAFLESNGPATSAIYYSRSKGQTVNIPNLGMVQKVLFLVNTRRVESYPKYDMMWA